MRSSTAPSSAPTLALLLRLLGRDAVSDEAELGIRERLSRLAGVKLLGGTRLSAETERLQRQLERLREDTTDEGIWRSVELARHQERPYTLDYVERMSTTGSRSTAIARRADDHAIVAGLGSVDGRTIAIDRAPEGPRHQGAEHAGTSGWPIPRGIARRCG